MKAEILIVTFHRDYPYLKYCLRSIDKFCTGFSQVNVVVPSTDFDELRDLIAEIPSKSGIPINPIHVDEWEGKGFLHHMYLVMMADAICANADFIAHLDADCVFTDPVTPATFIKDGSPILQFERFSSIGKRHPGVLEWQRVTEQCLPFLIEFETMRQHPEIYHRGLYQRARELILEKTGLAIGEYIRLQKESYPQSFCEHVTLGNVAMHEFTDKYWQVDRGAMPNPDKGLFPTGQFWSHAAPDQPQHIWWNGAQEMIVPMDKIRELGLE